MSSTSTNSSSEQIRLESRLGYSFRDKELLEQALTHKSHSRRHNERLEYLGDAVLGFVIAEALYASHPAFAEDALTMIRADLVRRETLGEVAVGLKLGDFLRLGPGERKSGGKQRVSILADTVEAIIGAVSQDGGIEAGRELVLRLYKDALASVADLKIEAVKDPKTKLQEILQAESLPLPVYDVVATAGVDHKREFTVACRVESRQLETTGQGSNRRGAEKMAAQRMIDRMNASD